MLNNQLYGLAQLFELGVLGPCTDWCLTHKLTSGLRLSGQRGSTTYLEVLLVNIRKSSILHTFMLQFIFQYSKWPACLAATLMEDEGPLAHCVGGLDATIVALHDRLRLKTLEIAARSEYAVGLLEEGAPVGNATHHPADVDIIK